MAHLTDDIYFKAAREKREQKKMEREAQKPSPGQVLCLTHRHFNGVQHPMADPVRKLLGVFKHSGGRAFTQAEQDRVMRVIKPLFAIGSGEKDAWCKDLVQAFVANTWYRMRFDYVDRADLLEEWIHARMRAVMPSYGAVRCQHPGKVWIEGGEHKFIALELHNPETPAEYEQRVQAFTRAALQLALLIVRSADTARLPDTFTDL